MSERVKKVQMVELTNGTKEPVATVKVVRLHLKDLYEAGKHSAICDLVRSSFDPDHTVDPENFQELYDRGLVDENGLVVSKSVTHIIDASVGYVLPRLELIDPIKK